MNLLILSLALLAFALGTEASILKIKDMDITQADMNGFVSVMEAVYAKGDASGTRKPRIAAELNINKKISSANISSILEFSIVKSNSLDVLGYPKDRKTRMFCCTMDRMNNGVPGCTRVNHIIIDPRLLVDSHEILFEEEESSKFVNVQFSVSETSFYHLVLSNCDDVLAKYTVNGEISFVNPYGFLPGHLYGYLYLYFSLMIFCLVSFGAWFAVYHKHAATVLMLHHLIAAVAILFLFEVLFRYVEFSAFNKSGKRSELALFIAVLSGVFRRTIARALAVAVCHGYGVLKNDLGALKNQIFIVSMVYFLFSMIFEIFAELAPISNGRRDMIILVSLPVSIVNTFIAWWVLNALDRTCSELESRHQKNKLQIYSKLKAAIAISLGFAIFVDLYRVYLMHSHNYIKQWESFWFFEAGCSQLIFLLLLLTVLFLWLPNENSSLFASLEQISDDNIEFGIEMEGRSRTSSRSSEAVFSIGDE